MAVGRTFMVQHVHLGPTGVVRTATFTALNNGGAGPWLGQLGQMFEQDGKFFRLVKFSSGTGAVAAVDGGVMYWKDKANYLVTSDASDAEGTPNGVAGGSHVVVATGSYFFMQCGGDQLAVILSAAGAIGSLLSGHATTDNALVPTAAGTATVNLGVGVQLAARGTTTSDVGASVANSAKVRWLLGSLI